MQVILLQSLVLKILLLVILYDPDQPVILERMEFPDPVIEVAVEPKTKADQEKWELLFSV